MTDLSTIVDAYLTAYGEPDRMRRETLIARAFAGDAELIDPPMARAGHDGISELAVAVQQQFAGHRFRRTSDIDEHHGHLRYSWELVGPDENVALTGIDVAELAGDGRMQRVVGFFGALAPAAGSVA